MTFGAADALLSATAGSAVSAATPGARSADMRSVSSVELPALPPAAESVVVSAPGGSPQPSTAIAAPNARGARVDLQRNAIAGASADPAAQSTCLARPPAGGAGRPVAGSAHFSIGRSRRALYSLPYDFF